MTGLPETRDFAALAYSTLGICRVIIDILREKASTSRLTTAFYFNSGGDHCGYKRQNRELFVSYGDNQYEKLSSIIN